MARRKPANQGIAKAPLRPGDRVIIRQNPHDYRSEEVVGTVIVFRPSVGFAGSDLVDIHYKSPVDGQGATRPFGLSCLGPATPSDLISLAERFERRAADLRALAESSR